MLKYLLLSASLFSTAFAEINELNYPYNTNTNISSFPLVVTDLIGDGNDAIDAVLDAPVAVTTYVGLWEASTVTSSHHEQATGGPITKGYCSGTICRVNLYQNNDPFDPVPEGSYELRQIDETVLTYATVGTARTVTINPYISAWGNTLTQTAVPDVERGSDVLVTFDGLAAADVIEMRYKSGVGTIVTDCAVDYHIVTAAEAAAGRGTISLKTVESTESGKNAFNLVPFAVTGIHEIKMVTGTPAYTADCSVGAQKGVTREVNVKDSDTINVEGAVSNTATTGVEAGSKMTITYYTKSAVTSGTYVGLWRDGVTPDSHTIDADNADTGKPLSKAYLPVGVAGNGTIELSVPITASDNEYTVYMFNDNDNNAIFSPLADTSYTNRGEAGPFVTGGAGNVHNTDVDIIAAPTGQPTSEPSGEPSGQPSGVPSSPSGEPTSIPTSSPSFVEEPWGEYVWTEKRHRKAGMCENQCSGHGTCEVNGNCKCFKGLDGEAEWTGPDCSWRTCPYDFAWVGASINSNNLHPWAECSNKGLCDRETGECQCFTGYEGAACQRTVCPDNCNDQGTCWPEKHLASKAGRVYDTPWDAMKHVGCLCDAGFRGPACDQQECPSGADPLSGYGNEAGRDCSGRGICDYSSGICACFTGFFGTRCQHQTTVM